MAVEIMDLPPEHHYMVLIYRNKDRKLLWTVRVRTGGDVIINYPSATFVYKVLSGAIKAALDSPARAAIHELLQNFPDTDLLIDGPRHYRIRQQDVFKQHDTEAKQ